LEVLQALAKIKKFHISEFDYPLLPSLDY